MLPEKKQSAIQPLKTIGIAKVRLRKAGALGKVVEDLLDKAIITSSTKALMIANAIRALPKDLPLQIALKEEIQKQHSPLYDALNFHRNFMPITFWVYLTSLFIFFSCKARSLLIAENACKELERSGQTIQLTPEAAKYMLDNKLTIRNSHTKQLVSLHYGLKFFPEHHSAGSGHYCVPLWTVAVPGLMEANFNDKTAVKEIIKKYTNSSAPSLGKEEQNPQHLQKFLTRIREFISPHVVLGYRFEHQFDYELLVAKDDLYYLDNFGTYPTGGRGFHSHNSESIIYRVTLNRLEVAFLKKILKGEYDEQLPGITEAPSEVAITARQTLAHQVCIEIITRKLVQFLNAAGNLKNVICFNDKTLQSLLPIIINSPKGEVRRVLEQGLVHARLQVDELLASDKYSHTPAIR
ncbi:Uncharacterised protein (plasmid) [Legionella adelaidensis]|uniref:Uncharacterized protein n=1 Tax=Legionella adelaidensis TaxID=45056 RepID=A0A0W0R0V3_9GAMM|nr:hypothetical protein [Legionella adelaidensis]KTC64723.1 hypothetical protein Lade_2017 [Legionella adelaidensis]VEH82859.1 Uncharacterised protein [Legionella adelaidensis]